MAGGRCLSARWGRSVLVLHAPNFHGLARLLQRRGQKPGRANAAPPGVAIHSARRMDEPQMTMPGFNLSQVA